MQAIARPIHPRASLDQVVEDVNALHRRNGLRFACELGRLLVDRFHDGDFAEARRRGAKETPLRELAATPGLTVSFTTLWTSIRVAEQVERLGDVAWLLTVSHHRELLRLRSPTNRRELANRCVQAGWSVRELRDAVTARRPAQGGERRGRRPTPSAVKAISRVERALADLGDGPVELDPGASAELRQRLDRQIDALLALRQQLVQGAEEVEPPSRTRA